MVEDLHLYRATELSAFWDLTACRCIGRDADRCRPRGHLHRCISRVPTENEKGFGQNAASDLTACLAAVGLTETLQR
jgi:hypothetical protein